MRLIRIETLWIATKLFQQTLDYQYWKKIFYSRILLSVSQIFMVFNNFMGWNLTIFILRYFHILHVLEYFLKIYPNVYNYIIFKVKILQCYLLSLLFYRYIQNNIYLLSNASLYLLNEDIALECVFRNSTLFITSHSDQWLVTKIFCIINIIIL